MFDTYVAQLVLNERKIAYLITNQSLQVTDCGGHLPLVQSGLTVLSYGPANDPFVAAALLGKSIVEITPELIGYEEQLQALLRGELPRFRLDFVNREDTLGDVLYLTLTLYPRRDDAQEIQGILFILEDISAIGRVDQQLTQQHNELSLLHRRLSDTNLQLTAANAELRALDELKSRFVSIAAHELRTPIATMLGYIDFMLQDEQEALPPMHRNSIDIVQRSTKRLLTITSDLLDVTRLEAGRMELLLESVNLVRLLNALLVEFQPEIAKKSIAVTLHAPDDLPPTLCDEKRTIQIFTNLLSNAIKYTPERGTITITLQPSHPAMSADQSKAHHSRQTLLQNGQPEQGEPTMILVTIMDTGIGIPAKDLVNMGKAFFRASNVHIARVSGTGLGLHITRSLCELQGGGLWFDSEEGVGTTATVTIPIDEGTFAS